MRLVGKQISSTTLLMWLLLGLTGLSGCEEHVSTETETQPVAVIEPAAEFDGLSPEELFTAIRQVNDEYDSVAELFQSSGGRHRLNKMRELVDRTIVVAECIENHEQASDDETKSALRVQIRMYHQGLSMGWQGFEQRTDQFAQRLAEQHADTVEAAVIDAILVKHAYLQDDQLKAADTESAIEAHVMKFPEQPTGPKLYADYARLLLKNNDLKEATRVCRDVIDVYGNVPMVSPLKGVLRTIRTAQRQEHREQSYYLSRANEFGGRTHGYFVLFLRPEKLGYMSPVDYVVCHGIKEAVQAADSSPRFKLEAWFPDTPSGRQQANAKAEELYQKNTIEMMVPR